MNDQDEMFEAATELPAFMGCPSLGPKTLPSGFDGTEPAKKVKAKQRNLLAAAKSFDADVERAKYISNITDCVMREMCKTCEHKNECESDGRSFGCLATINCRMAVIASIAAGMIMEGGAK